MATLRIVSRDGSERLVKLPERKVQIGRGRDNDIVLADPDKSVSRTHAELRYESGRYVIVDLQSQNGTWVNGRRVERAEVPPGAEIIVGDYRLRLQEDSSAAAAGATIVRPAREVFEDLEIGERPSHRDVRMPPPTAVVDRQAPSRRLVFGAALVVAAVILFGAIAWIFGPARQVSAGPEAVSEPRPAGQKPTEPAPALPPPPDVAPGERAPDLADPFRPASPKRPTPERVRPERVARKPGESVEAFRVRAEALQTRYTYSKAALDRRDYAAAAGGFQAILLEEPGFLDAPKLLVQAQEGLRATANALYQSGRRLDAAGDWVGALQKYEQARQVYSNLPGLADAASRARDRLRAAGNKAFSQAQLHEIHGRNQEALLEYGKAVQWLASDDPNRRIARARIEELRKKQ